MTTHRGGMPHKLFPRKQNEAGEKLCRYCGKILSGRRSAWCSDKCSNEAMIRCYPSWARSAVQLRDKGVCATCGTDTISLQRRTYKKIKDMNTRGKYKRAEKFRKYMRSKGWPCDWYGTRSWWDADHIHPVVEGGGLCGLENYRTLCVPCHKKETAELAKRRAKNRSPQQDLFSAAPPAL
jgi:5-methylcytosine-specific restriction protein A